MSQEQISNRMAPLSGGSVSYFNLLFQIVVHLGTVGVLSIGGGSVSWVFSVLCKRPACYMLKSSHPKWFSWEQGGAFKRQVKGDLTTEWVPGIRSLPLSLSLASWLKKSSFTYILPALLPSTSESTWGDLGGLPDHELDLLGPFRKLHFFFCTCHSNRNLTSTGFNFSSDSVTCLWPLGPLQRRLPRHTKAASHAIILSCQ